MMDRERPAIGAPVGWTFCSGIGAPEIAAPWVDWRLASEIEPFPREVLQARFGHKSPEDHNQGEMLLWADMTEVTPDLARAHGVPLPDLLVAGTPCQAFSLAGLRDGVRDPRGNLTLKFVESCHAIVDARNDGRLAVLWENVPGVLSDKENAFGAFLGGLVGADDPLSPPGGESWPRAGMVCGPRARVAWRVFDAQYFGVAQQRKRVFVVADFGGGIDPAQILFEPQGVPGGIAAGRETGAEITGVLGAGTGRGNQGGSFDLTGGLQPGIPEFSRTLNAGGMGRCDAETETFLPVVAFDCKGTEVQSIEGGINPPLRTAGGQGHAAVADRVGVRRLMPVECHRLQGFPEGHCAIERRGKPAADGPQYTALGNSMAVPNIAWILGRMRQSAGWL
ncbi:MAG: DNA cytosine methyltransferase [Gammaproteobacteria bacterium]|nr:DNA cytosine methyltransferase [Gammaproteobacteria bacterium]